MNIKHILLIGAGLYGSLPLVAQESLSSDTLNKIENFKEHDPFGVSMAIIAMGVVFFALLILYLCFKWSGRAMNKEIHRPSVHKGKQSASAPIVRNAETGAPADEEVAAAIGMALFLAEDGMHDRESDTLTLAPTAQAWTGSGNNHKHSPLRKF